MENIPSPQDGEDRNKKLVEQVIELVETPGFDQLPPIEIDYLIELIILEARGISMRRSPPWDKSSSS